MGPGLVGLDVLDSCEFSFEGVGEGCVAVDVALADVCAGEFSGEGVFDFV